MRVFGLILAGGEGRRIGGEKPAKILKDKPLLLWAISPFLSLNLHGLIISVKDEAQEERLRHLLRNSNISEEPLFLRDLAEFRGRGPLSGILSAMWAYPEETLLIVSAVDQPFVLPELLEDLVTSGKKHFPKVCVYETERGPEPFPMACSSSLRELFQEFIKISSKPSIKALFSYLSSKKSLVTSKNWLTIDPDCLSFININTTDELKAFDDILSSV